MPVVPVFPDIGNFSGVIFQALEKVRREQGNDGLLCDPRSFHLSMISSSNERAEAPFFALAKKGSLQPWVGIIISLCASSSKIRIGRGCLFPLRRLVLADTSHGLDNPLDSPSFGGLPVIFPPFLIPAFP